VAPCIVQHHPKGRGPSAALKVVTLPHTCRTAKKPKPPKRIIWNVYKIASKAVWLGEVEAVDEAAAMEKAAAEFKVAANRLMAIRR
jgi:hypothetical protein